MVDFSNVRPSQNVVDLRPATYNLEAQGDIGSDEYLAAWIEELLKNHPEKRDVIAKWLYHQDYPVTTGGPETGATGLNADYINAILDKQPIQDARSGDESYPDSGPKQEMIDMILNIFPGLQQSPMDYFKSLLSQENR